MPGPIPFHAPTPVGAFLSKKALWALNVRNDSLTRFLQQLSEFYAIGIMAMKSLCRSAPGILMRSHIAMRAMTITDALAYPLFTSSSGRPTGSAYQFIHKYLWVPPNSTLSAFFQHFVDLLGQILHICFSRATSRFGGSSQTDTGWVDG